MNEIQGKSALILGYGIEGQSVFRFLKKIFPEMKVGIADVMNVDGKQKGLTIHAGVNYLDAISQYDTIIRSPGVSYFEVVKRNPKHLTSATNIFFSRTAGKVIGVTGTKGKSTTTSLIHQLLMTKFSDVRLVGNIGTPFLDELENQTSDTWFVAELSSHQLNDVRYSPHIAVVLDVTPEHLDYYPNFDFYKEAKARIVASQTNSDWVVGNPSHPTVSKIISQSVAQKKYFGMDNSDECQSFLFDGQIFAKFNNQVQPVIYVKDLKVLGPANIENVLAAITVGTIFQLDIEKVKNTLTKFVPLPHRLSSIGIYKNIEFFNDSLATTPEAVINALDALKGRPITLIAGGYDRGVKLEELVNYLIGSKDLVHLILLPETGNKIAGLLNKASHNISLHQVLDLRSAVDAAFSFTQKGGVCVLSPGAASFNQFKDYKDRGDQFVHYVKTYQ